MRLGRLFSQRKSVIIFFADGALATHPRKFWLEQNIYVKTVIPAFSREGLRMDVSRVLRFLAAVLILISGVIGVVAGLAFSGTFALAVGVGFGVLYLVIGVGLFVGKRLFSYLGVIFPLMGGIGGIYVYVTTQVTPTLVAVVIDVIVILCCGYLLLHKKS